MTRRSVAATILFLLVPVGGVFAFNEPDGFRGVPWGASEHDLVEAIGRLTPTWGGCEDIAAGVRWLGDRLCTGPFDIAGISVTANYVFRSDRFVKVGLHFPGRDFGRVAAIFIERYGTPTHRGRDIIRWEGASVLIALSQHVDGKGYANIATQDELRESKRLRDEQTKGAAKGCEESDRLGENNRVY